MHDKDDDYEARKLEAMRPLMFEAGAALWDCRLRVRAGSAALLFFRRLGAAGLDAAALNASSITTTSGPLATWSP